MVLLQWAQGEDGPVSLHSIFETPIKETLNLIEFIVHNKEGILGFNLVFDWFHLCKTYNTLRLLPHDAYPIEIIDKMALAEKDARDGPCLRPQKVLDLMLFARKGPYQNTMNRDPIKIRRVPRVLAPLLVEELEKRVKLRAIFFAKKKKDTEKHWRIVEIKGDTDFVHVELVFAPTSAMKALATDALEIPPEESLVYSDVEIDRKFYPIEFAYAPFASAVGKPGRWNGAWPDVVQHHITHWGYNKLARLYAERDVTLPIRLWKKWGSPEFGDRDSELAIAAAAARLKGYAINRKGIEFLRKKAAKKKLTAPISPKKTMQYISEVLSEEELICLEDEFGKPSTKKQVLEEIAKQRTEDTCPKCQGKRFAHCDNIKCVCKSEKCSRCKGSAFEPTKAALRCEECLAARKAKKDEELYDKILIAGRLHASFNIIGARSGRKSGGSNTDGKSTGKKSSANKKKGIKKKGGSINPQGIQKKKLVKAQFQIAFTDGMSKIYEIGNNYTSLCSCAVCKENSIGFDAEIKDNKYEVKFDNLLSIAYITQPNEDLEKCLDTVFERIQGELKWIVSGAEEEILVGGDFDAFEVTIADAYYEDPQLHKDLTAQANGRDGLPLFDEKGKPVKVKIHAIIGSLVYKPKTYWEIIDTDGKDVDLYTRAKSAFFALIYFGNAFTLASRLNIEPELGEAAYQEIMRRYPVMDKKRKIFFDRYCPMKQPGGLGTRVYWEQPWDFVESMLGFKRFFTLENMICHALFDLGEKPPGEWRKFKFKVVRRDREQSASGAVQSAIIGACFQLQNANMRAAGNHVIQSTGAELTKILEFRLWALQPKGIYRWHIRPMNIHDELMCPVMRKLAKKSKQIVDEFLKEYKKLIPLLGMKWKVPRFVTVNNKSFEAGRIYSWAGK